MIRVKKSSEEQRNMELSSWNKQNQKSNHPENGQFECLEISLFTVHKLIIRNARVL